MQAKGAGGRCCSARGLLLHCCGHRCRRLEDREKHSSKTMWLENKLTLLSILLLFIAGYLLQEGEEKPLHSSAASCMCVCHPTLQPCSLLLSETNRVLKLRCLFSTWPTVARGAQCALCAWAAGPQSHKWKSHSQNNE